ncbi:MAG: chromosome segregation protein SMC [Methanobacteriota archaeon]
MHLKGIQLENFKSFGRKLEVPILPGYTAVTGPNGSGKSNISDAVLFVLGPKSSRAIRAGKLPDLIFNGGKSRRAADECTVSLIFDNQDRIMPIDSQEVRLTRTIRLSKSTEDGYSSYFYINERKSSLGEFDDLLSHARISADGYNFIQQGDINRIISMSNLERRRMLDDIAGITKFDEDIGKAERERTVVEDNLGKITIILDEIGKQLKQLEHDRTDALKYKELKERADLASAQMVYKNRDVILHEIEGLDESIAKGEAEVAKLAEKREAVVGELKGCETELQKLESEIASKSSEEMKSLKMKIDGLKIEAAKAESAAENALAQSAELKEQRSVKSRDLAKLSKELEAHRAELEKHEGAYASLDKKLAGVRDEAKGLEDTAAKSDKEVTVLQKKVLGAKNELEAKQRKRGELLLEKDRLSASRERALEIVSQAEQRRKDSEFALKDAEWRLKELKGTEKVSTDEIKKIQEAFFAKRSQEQKLGRESVELASAVQTLARRYEQLKAEVDAQDSVRKGYNAAVQSILEARDKGHLKGIHGTVAELAKVDRKQEVAMNTAAGPRMQSIIVDDDECASKAIDYLNKTKAGRAAFLPLNKMLESRPRGKALLAVKESMGFAIDLIKFDDKYRNAFSYVFGDTIVVDTLEHARRLMGGVRLVTISGELIEASGAMIGGKDERSMVKFGGGAGELEKASKELRAATEHLDRLEAELKKLREELLDLEGKLKDAGAKSGPAGEKAKHEMLVSESKRLLKISQEEIEKGNAELKGADGTLVALTDDLAKLQVDIERLDGEAQALGKKLVAATPEEIGRRLRQIQMDVTKMSTELAKIDSVRNVSIGEVKVREELLEEGGKTLAEMDAKLKSLAEIAKTGKSRNESLRVEIDALAKTESGMDAAIQAVRDKRDAAFKRKTTLGGDAEKLLSKVQSRQDFVDAQKLERQGADQRLRDAEASLRSVKLEKTDELPSIDEIKRTLAECQASMERLGNVNMRSLEVYDDQLRRHEELKEELKRLNDQRKRLLDLVAELNGKKKEGLVKVFEGINERFKVVFAELSEGGDAELILENPEDPLNGGLGIKARPKGKKVLRLDLLSGGEKGLVSMALIFAIQQYMPSPFYLLDEIDQNLDAINAENVARMIGRNSKTAQFIQISLRKVTLAQAQTRIGVTMQDDGLSHVVMNVDISKMDDSGKDSGTPEARRLASEAIKAAMESSALAKAETSVKVEAPKSVKPKKSKAAKKQTVEDNGAVTNQAQEVDENAKESPEPVPETAKRGDE